MRTALPALLLLLAVLVPATPGMAQDASAPHLSPTDKVLYAHHHDSDTAELNGWMNALVTDPTGNDVALGPSTSVPGAPAGNFAGTRTHTLTLNPALQGTVKLDPAGNIVINAYIGSGSGNGVVRVSTEIRYGGEVVATGAAVNHAYQAAGTGPYGKVTWTVAPAITEFAPGKDLVWTVTLAGVAQAAFFSVSAERGSSGIEFPVLSSTVSGGAGGTGPTYHDLNETKVDVTLPGTASNGMHQVNWTSPGGSLAINVTDPTHAGGNATIQVRDGANATLANLTFNGTQQRRALVGDAGNWTILVHMDNYTGNLTIAIGPGPSGGGSDGGTSSGPGTTSTKSTSKSGTAGSSSNSTTKKDGKDTPLPALPALIGVLAAAVLLARRRR